MGNWMIGQTNVWYNSIMSAYLLQIGEFYNQQQQNVWYGMFNDKIIKWRIFIKLFLKGQLFCRLWGFLLRISFQGQWNWATKNDERNLTVEIEIG